MHISWDIVINEFPFSTIKYKSCFYLLFFVCMQLNSDEDDPEFRYLFTDCGIQPTQRNNFGIPKDLIDFFSEQQSQTTLNDIINLRLENVS